MASDRCYKPGPDVEHELTLFGLPARVVIELTTKRGHTVHVPIGDQCEFMSCASGQRGYSTIQIPVRGAILRRVMDAVDDTGLHGL